jgi:hypothetical protein
MSLVADQGDNVSWRFLEQWGAKTYNDATFLDDARALHAKALRESPAHAREMEGRTLAKLKALEAYAIVHGLPAAEVTADLRALLNEWKGTN